MRRQLDLSKVTFSERYISTEEALEDVLVSEEVLSGRYELIVCSAGKRWEAANGTKEI